MNKMTIEKHNSEQVAFNHKVQTEVKRRLELPGNTKSYTQLVKEVREGLLNK